ncbi:MAG: choice-of-anchor Q domain-containing protein [bacterium]
MHRCSAHPITARRIVPRFSAVLGAALLLAGTARATVYNVSVTADDANLGANGNCTLREAIQAANGNVAVDACAAGSVGADTIVLAAGTYTLSIPGAGEDASATGDLDVTESLTIRGASAASTTISASGLGDRILQIASSALVEISDLTLSGARLTGGTNQSVSAGGIWNDGDLTLTRARVVDNRATGGNGNSSAGGGSATAGGILSSSTGSLTLDTVEVSQNVAAGGNGGTGCCSMSCSCMFGQPAGTGTGGGILSQGLLSIRNSTIQDNAATSGQDGYFGVGAPGSAGGGVASYGATATILDTLFARNSTTGGRGVTGGAARGGALYVGGGTVSLTQSLVAENTATGNTSNLGGNGGAGGGAGAFVAGGATLAVTNSTFAKNLATGGAGSSLIASVGGAASGGAIDSDGTVTLTSATLADNQVTGGAPGVGTAGAVLGGALNSDGSTTLVNTVIAASLAVVPGGATTGEACDGTVAVTSSGGNLESPANTCALSGSGDLAAISAASLNLQALANNGGATWTQALGTGSPAINTGLAAACPSFDQRHYARNAGVCDRGAYEVNGAPCTDGDYDGYSTEGGACGAVDCNDANAAVHPGAVEIPGNGIDDDCNAATPGCLTPQAADAAVGTTGSGSAGLGGSLGAAMFLFAGLKLLRRRFVRA